MARLQARDNLKPLPPRDAVRAQLKREVEGRRNLAKAVLATLPPFRALPDDVLALAAEGMVERDYADGTVIVAQVGPDDRMLS